jgi:hypothetical protein
MSEKEDFPAIPEAETDSESDSDSESELDEVEFTRTQLQEFIASHGGYFTEQMSDAICAVIGAFTQTELNSLLVGNTGQTLTEEEWNQLLARNEEDSNSEEVQSLQISLTGDDRTVYSNTHGTAATKIQAAWRIQKAARTLIMLKN